MTVDATKVKRPIIYRPEPAQTFLNLLVYGDPGVGKTTLAESANRCEYTAPALIANVEGGMLSIVGNKPDVVDIGSYQDLEEVFWWLASGDHEYRTFVIDSLNEAQELNLDSIVTGHLSTTTKKGASRSGIDDRWLDDFGDSASQMGRLLRNFRDLPMHTMFTCLARTRDEDGEAVVKPHLTPALCGRVMQYMDIVGYLYTQEVASEEEEGMPTTHRRLLCQPFGRYSAKDRSGRLGTIVDNPTINSLMGLILREEE